MYAASSLAQIKRGINILINFLLVLLKTRLGAKPSSCIPKCYYAQIRSRYLKLDTLLCPLKKMRSYKEQPGVTGSHIVKHCPQNLIPQTPSPNPNPVQPSSKTQSGPRGLGLTLKSCRPIVIVIDEQITKIYSQMCKNKNHKMKNYILVCSKYLTVTVMSWINNDY